MKIPCELLPSRGIPYAVKEVNISPFRPVHMSYISEAICTQNNQPLIEAMRLVMDIDPDHLTESDFYYLLTWQRFNCRDLPMYSEWECGGTYFTRKDSDKEYTIKDIDALIDQWEKAEGTEAQAHMENPREIEFFEQDCDHHNKQKVGFEDFRILQMPANSKLDPRLDYPRVRHMVEAAGLREQTRYRKLLGPVGYIREGETLHAKFQLVEEMEEMELFDLASRAHYENEHGILQRVWKDCERCGTPHAFDVSIEAQSFFMV